MSEDVKRNSLPPRELDALSEIGNRYPVPPFRVFAFVPRERARGGTGSPPDAMISLEWEGQIQQFAVEYKASGSPQQIDLAIQQVRRYTRETPDIAPLIVAPFLNPELLERLIEERVSGIDLSGNYAVTIPGRWLVVRSGSKNQFPSSAPIKNVYRGKSSLVPRALMLKGSFPTATAIMNDLAAFGAVTLPTISKVLKSLEEEGIIVRGEEILVAEPDRLLENLVSNYRAPLLRRTLRGKLGLSATVTARLSKNAGDSGIYFAADSSAEYAILPSSDSVTRIYTSSIEKLLSGAEIDERSRFPDADLMETDDWSVYYGRVLRNNSYRTSPLQVYLELASGGKREQQAAAQMRPDLLQYRYA